MLIICCVYVCLYFFFSNEQFYDCLLLNLTLIKVIIIFSINKKNLLFESQQGKNKNMSILSSFFSIKKNKHQRLKIQFYFIAISFLLKNQIPQLEKKVQISNFRTKKY